MSGTRWRNRLLTLVIALCLLWQSTVIVLAQTDAEDPVLDFTNPVLDDTPVEPYVPKSEITTSDPNEEKKPQQGSHNLFIPQMVAPSSDELTVQAAATPVWRTILTERFEGVFPPTGGNWSIFDYNGPSVGSPPNPAAKVVWDDTSTRAYTGYWSAHPNAYYTYANNTDTWMKYGPLNLVGGTNAQLKFAYYLDTETYFDFFSVEYSCANKGYWDTLNLSGKSNGWIAANVSLVKCLGSANVYIRFNFRSDYSNPTTPPGGVWVDDIVVRVLK